MRFRGAYLGMPGDMFMFAHVRGDLGAKTSRAASYQTTLGGRLRAQVSPVSLREWDCRLPLSVPEETARFKALAMGLFGVGPFAWVPVDASVVNVLSPGASMPGPTSASWIGDATPAGQWAVPELGLVRHSVLPQRSSLVLADGTPCVPGLPILGSVYVAGQDRVTVTVEVLDAAGAVVASATSTPHSGIEAHRISALVPSTPPAAASCRLRVSNATQVGLPAVSWTNQLTAWVPGGGSRSVLVEGFETSLTRLHQTRALYESVSFTVKELSPDA